jgi:hypothetical protein
MEDSIAGEVLLTFNWPTAVMTLTVHQTLLFLPVMRSLMVAVRAAFGIRKRTNVAVQLISTDA